VLQQGLQANQSDNQRYSLYTFFFCVLLVAVCYANSVTNAFILDDVLIVAANERIRNVQPIQFLLQPYWHDQEHAGIYRPLTIFSFSLEYSVWKAWAPGFRLTNLLLHALNGWLVFLIVRGLIGSPLAAWASAAVYVAHPVQTEAVVSIVGRSELLAATLFFTAWLAFRKGRTAWSCLAYALALLAKESAITFPAVAAVDLALSEGSIRKVIESWKRLAALAVCSLAYLALRFYVLGGLGVPVSGQYVQGAWTRGQLLLTSGRVFVEYLRLLFVPVHVTGDYDFNSIPLAGVRDWDAWLGLVLILSCIAMALWNAKKRQGISLGILFFFIALLPVSNWIMPIALLMAERFLYTPVFGFSLLAGICWTAIPKVEIRRIAAVGILAVAALLCISHNYIWQDTLTFHTNVVRLLPNNARARLGYGYALMRLGKFEEARSQFEEGLRILPKSAPLLTALAGSVMRIDGQCARVRPILDQAFAVAPGQWQGLWILGDCFVSERNLELAERSYGMAVKNAPFPDGRLLISWGNTLERMGNATAAQAAYERGRRIDPSLFKSGRPREILQYAQPDGTNERPDPGSSSWLRSER
jgi:tetratricopeptide (TPR) repeat protein